MSEQQLSVIGKYFLNLFCFMVFFFFRFYFPFPRVAFTAGGLSTLKRRHEAYVSPKNTLKKARKGKKSAEIKTV